MSDNKILKSSVNKKSQTDVQNGKVKCCLRTCNEKATNRVGIGGLFHYVCFDHALDRSFD